MHVGLFTESYDPIINGVSTSVKTLAMELARAGHDPTVVAPRFPGYEDMECSPDGVTVLRLPAFRSSFNPQNPFAFPPMGTTPDILRDVRFDVVHTQQPFGMGRHGRHTSRRLRVPLVSTFHTLYTEYTHYFPVVSPAMARWWLKDQLWRYYETCDAIIVPSHATGELLLSIGISPQRLEVIPTGVPAVPVVVPAAIHQARRRFSLPETAPVLLFVGRLAKEKHLDLLIDSFEKLCEDWRGLPEATHPILLLAGSGPYREECEARVHRLGLDRWVRFAGFLARTELAPVYALAMLFVFPSTTETQGVVLSEAQGFGLPCVVVRGGGASEFVRDGIDALVVSPDVNEFANAVRDLMTNEAKRFAFAAEAKASPLRPTPVGMAEHILEIYARVRKEREKGGRPPMPNRLYLSQRQQGQR